MPSIRAVFSDFGGVLYKTPNLRWLMRLSRLFGRSMDESLWSLYLSPTESPYVQAVMSGQIPEEEVWNGLVKRFGRNGQVWVNRMRATTYNPRRLNRPMITFFQSLRPRYITAILTNAASQFRSSFVHSFDMETWADRVIISAEVGLAKPDPQIFHLAAAQMDIAPQECLFFDDIPENVEGARQAGMTAFHFRSAPQAIAHIHSLLS